MFGIKIKKIYKCCKGLKLSSISLGVKVQQSKCLHYDLDNLNAISSLFSIFLREIYALRTIALDDLFINTLQNENHIIDMIYWPLLSIYGLNNALFNLNFTIILIRHVMIIHYLIFYL